MSPAVHQVGPMTTMGGSRSKTSPLTLKLTEVPLRRVLPFVTHAFTLVVDYIQPPSQWPLPPCVYLYVQVLLDFGMQLCDNRESSELPLRNRETDRSHLDPTIAWSYSHLLSYGQYAFPSVIQQLSVSGLASRNGCAERRTLGRGGLRIAFSKTFGKGLSSGDNGYKSGFRS